jgi:subtilase family serine protease
MLARTRYLAPTLVAAGAIIAACSASPSHGGSSSESTPGAASATALVPLARSVHPFARKEFDRGHRDPSLLTAGSLYFKMSDAQRADRDALVAAVQDPGSPSYHKWLSSEDIASRFGARAEDVARVRTWLEGKGLTIDRVSRTASRIQFRGTGGQVESAFGTELHDYVVRGKKHYAFSSAPMVPADLAPVVLGLHGFHDFHLHHPQLRRVTRPATVDPIYGETALGPADFAALYNTGPLTTAGTTGTGVNLVIIGETYYTPGDVSSFRSHFGLTGVHEVDVLVPDTGAQAVNDQGDLGETELDLEWSSAAAPGANIVFVYTGDDQDFSVDDSVAYAVEEGTHLVPGTGNGGAQIISESYGACDLDIAGTDADIDGEIAAAANLEGITYLAASGDSGAAGCLGEPGGGGLFTGPPADMPGVTAVGGLEFCGGMFAPGQPAGCYYNSGPSLIDTQQPPFFVGQNAVEYPMTPGGLSLEGVWNDSTIAYGPGGGGGGASIIWPKPAYQQAVAGMPNDGARDVPDVALTASANNVGYLVWEPTSLEDGGPTDGLGPVGGTSASTPSFAGILARVNQAVVAHGGPLGLGNVNPQLYSLFASNGASGAFHDIVIGDNTVPCDPNDSTDYPDCPAADGGYPEGGSSYGGYFAHPGYDLASGLGSVDATKLVTAWVGLTPTTTALTVPSTATPGTAVTLSATITSSVSSATSSVGGTVTFAFMTLAGDAGAVYSGDAGGGPDESWPLGTVNVTAVAGSPEKGTASLSAAIPPGLYGKAYLVAEYSGNTSYLASNSTPASLVTLSETLRVDPAKITLKPNQQATFTASGNKGSVYWNIPEATDTDCTFDSTAEEFVCPAIESTDPTHGAFQAGEIDGTVIVVGVDTAGQEATVVVTVAGAAEDGGTLPNVDDAGPQGGPANPPVPAWDGGEPTVDAGTWAGFDAAAPPSDDAGSASDGGSVSDGGGTAGDSGATSDGGATTTPVDAGSTADGGSGSTGSSSGCSCLVAGSERSSGESGGAAFGGLLLGLALVGRRTRRTAKR